MAEPFNETAAQRAEQSDVNLRNTRLPTVVRGIQVDQLDKLGGGSRAAAILSIATEPTAGDTVVIGRDTYEFVAEDGAVTDDDFIAVELTATVALTVLNLVAAINAVNEDDEHANITNVATTAPAKANGTELLLADVTLGAAKVRIRAAVAPGGELASTANIPSIALSETLTAAGDIWFAGSVNINTLGAVASGQLAIGRARYVAANVGANRQRVFSFPFAVADFIAQVRTAAGILKHPVADTWAISGNDVVLTLAGSGAPETVNTDIVSVVAYGA